MVNDTGHNKLIMPYVCTTPDADFIRELGVSSYLIEPFGFQVSFFPSSNRNSSTSVAAQMFIRLPTVIVVIFALFAAPIYGEAPELIPQVATFVYRTGIEIYRLFSSATAKAAYIDGNPAVGEAAYVALDARLIQLTGGRRFNSEAEFSLALREQIKEDSTWIVANIERIRRETRFLHIQRLAQFRDFLDRTLDVVEVTKQLKNAEFLKQQARVIVESRIEDAAKRMREEMWRIKNVRVVVKVHRADIASQSEVLSDHMKYLKDQLAIFDEPIQVTGETSKVIEYTRDWQVSGSET